MIRSKKLASHFPQFSDNAPNTITSVTLLSDVVDLRKAFENLKVLINPTRSPKNDIPRAKKLKFDLVEETGILSIRLKDNRRTTEPNEDDWIWNDENTAPRAKWIYADVTDDYPDFADDGVPVTRCWDMKGKDKKYSWLCRGLKGNEPFSRGLQLDYSGGTKNFAIKVFSGKNSNSKFQICGCRSYEELYSLVAILLYDLKNANTINRDAEIEWIDPSTIHYNFEFKRPINCKRLAEIFSDYRLNFGYDNLLSSRIEGTFESKVDKSHLKSKVKAIQRVKISPNGTVVINGPDITELEETYKTLVGIFDEHYDEIVAVDEKKIKNYIPEIIAMLKDKNGDNVSLTLSKIASKLKLHKEKTLIILNDMIDENKINLVANNYQISEEVEEVEIKIPIIEEDDILKCFTQINSEDRKSTGVKLTSEKVSEILFHNTKWENVTVINSILYRLVRKNQLLKEKKNNENYFKLA